MCSRALGPARLPSFVTWPTRNVGTFWAFAAKSNCVAASRTCPMLPGADCIFSENTVWIESTMTNAGLSRAISSSTRSRQVSASR